MTGEKDPRDVMQAEHDARLSEHPAFQAPAEMPGVEEIHAAFVEAQRQYRAERDAALAKQGYWPNRSPAPLDVLAKVAQALFAPILAEKELHHVTGERITRKDLNNAHRKGAEEGRLAAHLIDGVNSPLNACCYREQCKALEARALAAEAALAAERERCIAIVDAQVPDWVKERSGPYWDGYREAMEDAAEDMRKGVPARAAAIRAEGE